MPTAHAFSIGDDEFIVGSSTAVAMQIIEQCRKAGAGNFAATFDHSRPPEKLKEWYVEYGANVIPLLRRPAGR